MSRLVSVIIPAYNCEKYIGGAVASVLAQGHGDVEVIIIDDCSTDATFEACEKLAAGDARVQVHKNDRNLGPADTRNRGIGLARGEYAAFLDADDLWEADKLEKQLEKLEEGKSSLCYTSYAFMNVDGAPVGKPYIVPPEAPYETMLAENVVGLSTVLVKKAVLEKYGFDGSYAHEDYALWLRLLKDGYGFAGLPGVLVRYRRGGRSANKAKAAKGRWVVYREVAGLPVFEALGYFVRYALRGLKKRL